MQLTSRTAASNFGSVEHVGLPFRSAVLYLGSRQGDESVRRLRPEAAAAVGCVTLQRNSMNCPNVSRLLLCSHVKALDQARSGTSFPIYMEYVVSRHQLSSLVILE